HLLDAVAGAGLGIVDLGSLGGLVLGTPLLHDRVDERGPTAADSDGGSARSGSGSAATTLVVASDEENGRQQGDDGDGGEQVSKAHGSVSGDWERLALR